MDFSKLDPKNYSKLLLDKKNHIETMFNVFNLPSLEVLDSPTTNYRARTEFRVWHDGDDLYFYMFDKIQDKNIRCDQYLPASLLINELMLILIDELKKNDILRYKLFQVDFLSTLSGEILISLLYHKKLDDQWSKMITSLREKLSSQYKVNFVGRSRGLKINIFEDFVIEKIKVGSIELVYKQVENSFTQPNSTVAIKMLEWAIDVSKKTSGDLLELYCGNGNFSIALAPFYKKVLATEISKTSVESAQFNIKENKINNLNIVRLSAEELTEAFLFEREFNRLRGIDLKSYDFKTVLVDPPRSGLDLKSVEMISKYENIIYISCNPETLFENLEVLSKTHQIARFAIFDQFPYTDHIECGVFLTLKN